jgi:hypothetical protein
VVVNIKSIFLNLGKLLICSIAYAVGLVAGGMIVTMLGLQQPPVPAGLDGQSAMRFLLLQGPLLALVLALVARYLSGGYWFRSLALFALTWICNSLNNQIEATFFAGMKTGFLFTVTTFLFPALFVSLAVAHQFPSTHPKESLAASAKAFFSRFAAASWAWRLTLSALSFMPIYYFFGLLVIPFTRSFYEQNLFGLEIPSLNQLLVVLFIRSLLFYIAVVPILIAWQGSRWNLFWRLGLALFYLVGFQALIMANWMPWSLRLPHMIEILFDEFVYAGALVWLLGSPRRVARSGPEPRVAHLGGAKETHLPG